MYNNFYMRQNKFEVMRMDKSRKIDNERQLQEKFTLQANGAITNKIENQNQGHNAKKESLGPNTKR